MSGLTTTLRYTRAILELAKERHEEDLVFGDIQGINRILTEAPPIRDFCLKSSRDPKVRREFVRIAFCPYVHELMQRTLQIAAENNRLGIIPFLHDGTLRLKREEENLVSVVLETVEPAEPDLMKRTRQRMERRLGKKVVLSNRENRALLGGFRILWDDRLLDDSASGRIRRLRQKIRMGH